MEVDYSFWSGESTPAVNPLSQVPRYIVGVCFGDMFTFYTMRAFPTCLHDVLSVDSLLKLALFTYRLQLQLWRHSGSELHWPPGLLMMQTFPSWSRPE